MEIMSKRGCKMFPQQLSQEQLSDKKRNAEVKFYNALQSQLSKGWVVFYDVAWLAPVGGEVPRDGQTDFIVADPNKGILLIEIKGGRIAFDGPNQRWTSTDRAGNVYSIAPVKQVKEGKYALLEKLKSLPGLGNCWINIFHAVAFPDCEIPTDTPLEARKEILIGIDDLQNIEEKIESIFSFYKAESRPSPYGQQVINELASLLGRSIEFRNPLANQVCREEEQMLRLTEEQFEVLDALNRNRRVAVSGCAGSGKTFLAVEKARRLAHEGYKTLMTCYNRPLAEHLKGLFGDIDGLSVDTFHGFCRAHAREAGIDLSPFGKDAKENKNLEVIYPDTLLDVSQSRPDLNYDAIVVDEGQDFDATWWIALESCLKNKGSIFYIFYDDNQVLYTRQNELPDEMVHYRLGKNVRNTRPIFELVAQHYKTREKGEIHSVGPEGREVERISYSSDEDLGKQVGEALERFIVKERVPNEDVVVLTPKGLERSNLFGLKLPGKLELARLGNCNSANQILCSTIHSFKGLERKIVLVAELDEELFRLANDERVSRCCYVAFSRAQSHLTLIAKPEVLSQITGMGNA